MAKSTNDAQVAEKAPAPRESTSNPRVNISARRNRLPTLAEVLSRRTAAPLDLYCYVSVLHSRPGQGGEA